MSEEQRVKAYTRQQVLVWNDRWSHTDVRVIEENLDRLGVVSYVSPPSGGYIWCVDGQGRRVMKIAAGYLEFRDAFAPDEAEKWDGGRSGVDLSNAQFRRPNSPRRDEPASICPVHFVQLPSSGRCDDCG